MNCPQCNQPVGFDQYGYGPWNYEYDPAVEAVVDARRSISIYCSCCGVFEVAQDLEGRIVARHGPYTNPKDLRRLEKLIPACRHDRRVRR